MILNFFYIGLYLFGILFVCLSVCYWIGAFLISEKYMMAVIVGTIGGVAVIAFIIAAVRYVGHNNKKWVSMSN